MSKNNSYNRVSPNIDLGLLSLNPAQEQLRKIKRNEREIELEKIRFETFDKETEKMRLELEQSKQVLIESKKQLN